MVFFLIVAGTALVFCVAALLIIERENAAPQAEGFSISDHG